MQLTPNLEAIEEHAEKFVDTYMPGTKESERRACYQPRLMMVGETDWLMAIAV